ncbi:hypothetical protein E4T56_gene15343 [Termitomyces sp. T112]|nr:hypothetical protein E4T56_gene15343 [Termitomyces sp. T112]
MKLTSARANRNYYKSQLELIVHAHEVHVRRRDNDAEELQDLKLHTIRDLESWFEEMYDLHNDLRGFGYYLRLIRGDGFSDRISQCKSILIEIIEDYNIRSQARIVAERLAETSPDIIQEENLALERLREAPDLGNAHTRSVTALKPGILQQIRDLLNLRTQDSQSQIDSPATNPSVIFRLPSAEHISPFITSMQHLLSEPGRSTCPQSGTSVRENHRLYHRDLDHDLDLIDPPPSYHSTWNSPTTTWDSSTTT